MNIVYLVTRLDDLGGAAIHVRDLARALHRTGHQVHVAAGTQGIISRQLTESGISVIHVPSLVRPIKPRLDVQALCAIRNLLSGIQPDIVAAHSSKAGLIGRMAARTLGLPAVFTAHGWAFTDGVRTTNKLFYLGCEMLAAPLAHKIIAVSDYDRLLALRYHLTPPEKVTTIRNGVPDTDSCTRSNPQIGPPNILMVARFADPKDHLTLLRSLALLRDREWHLHLVGDGPLRATVERLAVDLQLGGRVTFWGDSLEVIYHLSQAQIFVLSSHWEGLPLSILEAMRAGLPIVASNVGGIPEAVVHGETGLLVSRADIRALAAALERLISSPDLRCGMGTAGRTRYERFFTFERMVRETMDAYEQVLAQG